jgi:hypothetical protein
LDFPSSGPKFSIVARSVEFKCLTPNLSMPYDRAESKGGSAVLSDRAPTQVLGFQLVGFSTLLFLNYWQLRTELRKIRASIGMN